MRQFHAVSTHCALLSMINNLISETLMAVGELSDKGMKCVVSDERSICSSSSLGSPVLKMDIVDVEPNDVSDEMAAS